MEVKKGNKAAKGERIEKKQEISEKEMNTTFTHKRATVEEMKKSEANDSISSGQSST